MKKILLCLLLLVLTVSAFSCGGGTENAPTVVPTEGTSQMPEETILPTQASSQGATKVPTKAPTQAPTQAPAKPVTYNADALYAASKVQGRVAVYDYLSKRKEDRRGISLDYTASAIQFTATCEGDVTLQVSAFPKGGTSAPYIFMNIYVDGKLMESRKACGFSKETDIVIATGLKRGTHTFLIERQNEAEKGQFYVNSVTLTGTLGKKPANSKLYIEFIGDSITTGYGNLYPDNIGDAKAFKTDATSSCYQDGTRAWAYLTAKKLGADYSIVAQQGIGASVGWQPHTMLQTYTQTCYQTGRTQAWNFSRQPDLIVINLGTNDLGVPHSTGKEAVQKGFVDLLKLVRSKNPNAKILWVYGAMDTSGAPVVEAAVKEAGGSSKGFYAYTKLVPNGEGGIGHPVVSAHQKNAGLVAAEIKRLFGY